jgi:aryl-alcohol dehydrogenase-like predicted oxidoreductase
MNVHKGTIVRRAAGPVQVSTVGIGTYLGAADDATDAAMERCLLAALRAGVNVIDTSPNYRAERSEAAVGRVLSAAAAEGIRREDVVVCTKVGFLPYHRESPRDPRSYYRTRFVDSGLLQPEWIYDTSQCFHPDYIAWQLGESLGRLSSGWVDIYYLHNPEALCLNLAAAEVECVVRAALRRIAGFCREGTVRFVGFSTWGAFVNEDGPERLSLGELTRWAAEEGLADFFRFVQLPVNLALPAALTTPTQAYQGRRWSAIRLARHLKLTVIASAPFMNGTLLQKPLPPELAQAFPGARTDAQRCLEFSRSAPGVATCLVGTTSPDHLREILEVAERAPMSEAAFAKAFC